MATAQHRNSSHPKRTQPPHARSPRFPANKRHLSQGPSAKIGSKTPYVNVEEPENDIMAASFPQYCTYCEKQIVVPSQSILYCSERCRRKDSSKALSYSSLLSERTPPPSPHAGHSFEDLPAHDIVPQRSPTAFNSHRFSTHFDQGVEDSIMHSEDEQGVGLVRYESEAARYLRQFHNPSLTDITSISTTRTFRPRYNRSSTSMTGMSTGAPSLSQSPTSSDTMSLPYTPSTRPLPPRANPFSSSYGAKNTDLVNPFAVLPQLTQTAPPSLQQTGYSPKTRPLSQAYASFAEDGNVSYEKTVIASSPPSGSLKQLFRFSEMQAPPSPAEYSRY